MNNASLSKDIFQIFCSKIMSASLFPLSIKNEKVILKTNIEIISSHFFSQIHSIDLKLDDDIFMIFLILHWKEHEFIKKKLSQLLRKILIESKYLLQDIKKSFFEQFEVRANSVARNLAVHLAYK